MFRRYEYRKTIYHSIEWASLVEQGWRTGTVEGGVATMIREVWKTPYTWP